MPKTFPIRLEVEEIALGPVLRKLNDMPGIVDLHLDLGHGGQGAGRKKLEEEAAKARSGESVEQTTIKLLLEGPKHISELSKALGGNKSRAYGAIHQLKKKGLIEASTERGTHQLTAKTRAQLNGARPALPAPEVKARAFWTSFFRFGKHSPANCFEWRLFDSRYLTHSARFKRNVSKKYLWSACKSEEEGPHQEERRLL
jgi:hypothetical protein